MGETCRSAAVVAAMVALGALAGCASSGRTQSTPKVNASLLAPSMLESHGLAFLTPTANADHDEDKQATALAFASILSETRPDIRVVPLAQTLGALNRTGLGRQYQKMYEGFRVTGLLDREVLSKLRGVTGTRYFGLLQLADFSEESAAGSGLPLASRTVRVAHIRVFLQIWDSVDGTIAWEGVDEVSLHENPDRKIEATFSAAAEQAARDLIAQLP